MHPKNPNHKGTVLVVDDTPLMLDILSKHLTKAKYEVLTAEDGKTALHTAEKAQPDVILLDIMMPEMNGYVTCQRLKENPLTKDIPVIFTTALTEIRDKLKAFEVGAVDYVTKPLDGREVIARVTTHLTIRNLQKKLQAEIIEREKAEEALRQYAAELQTRNEELDAFAHSVAHNLKNPLGALTGIADVIVSEYAMHIPDYLQTSLNAIARSGRKATNIVEELLVLASVHKRDVELIPLDMEEIVEEVQERLVDMIRDKQAEIILPASWPVALGHAPWIEEVWINYISNAIKYGGQPPCIELGATTQPDSTIRFWVKDNGRGLTAAEQEKLFTPFTRLSKTRAKGHGLGLSIVRSIVEKLGGIVEVESQGIPGQGSTFSFVLASAPH